MGADLDHHRLLGTLVVAEDDRLGEVAEGAAHGAPVRQLDGLGELKAKLLTLFITPATNMAKVLQAPLRDMLNVLNAKKDKDEG